jgi:hypothetical protein
MERYSFIEIQTKMGRKFKKNLNIKIIKSRTNIEQTSINKPTK